MFNIRNLFNKNNDMNKNGLRIIYEDGNLKNKVLSWCNYFKIGDIGDLLIKLGFNKDDVIYLYENYGSLSEVIYSVNKDIIDSVNTIEFNYKNREITVSDKLGYKIYCVNYMDNNYNIELGYQKRKVNDKISCFRTFKNNLFIVDNGDYELTFEMFTDSLITEDEFDDLEEYLISLDFPVIIDEVYNKICDILSMEQSMMEMFNLSITKNVGMKKVDMVLDNILIQKGDLVKFIKTVDDKRISVNKNGNWNYDKIDDQRMFSLNYDDKEESKFSYSFNGNKDMCFTVDDLVLIKDDAILEVDKVKKLIKTTFDK